MSELITTSMTRRDFAVKMTVLGSSAVLFAALPFSSTALAEVTLKWGQVPPLDMGRDEALENYPGYSAAIPCGTVPVFADVQHAFLDGQLFV